MNIVKKTALANTTPLAGRKILYIAIHYTAGVTSKPGSALNTAAWFARAAAKASADFIVDDSTIVQYNPDPANRYCWAVGASSKAKSKGGRLWGIAKNTNSISIEICSTNPAGKITYANDPKYSFTDAALDRAVELTKYLMRQYGIDADHVIRHYDVTGKLCPGIIGWNADSGSEAKWNAFHARLSGSAAVVTTPTTEAPFKPYTVRVTIPDLNIRSGAGTNFPSKGFCPRGVYTIVEEADGKGASKWGKLKSGAGWISLDFAAKI